MELFFRLMFQNILENEYFPSDMSFLDVFLHSKGKKSFTKQ